MNYVIHIGVLDRSGRFHGEQWRRALFLMAQLSHHVRVYTRMKRAELRAALDSVGLIQIEEESRFDPTLDVNSYLLSGGGEVLWNAISHVSMDPSGGLSHVYAMQGEACVASLEAEDGENFLLFSNVTEKDLLSAGVIIRFSDLPVFVEHSDEIDELAEGQPWKSIELLWPTEQS